MILALKKAGNVVGYIGDGINDASALHASDVGLSVDSAVDVAREAADFVLLEHDLEVLVDGVREGRRTFANTLKYVFIATSANFGNMFSMAGASLLLPFLPLLPKQILLINLLTDFPEMTIASDDVDPELTEQPRRWDIHFIRQFHACVRTGEFRFRLSDFRRFDLAQCNGRTIPHRLVHRINRLRVVDCSRRAHAPSIFQKPSEQIARSCHVGVVVVAVLIPHFRSHPCWAFKRCQRISIRS